MGKLRQVSRNWLDIHCLPDGRSARLLNKDAGHARNWNAWPETATLWAALKPRAAMNGGFGSA